MIYETEIQWTTDNTRLDGFTQIIFKCTWRLALGLNGDSCNRCCEDVSSRMMCNRIIKTWLSGSIDYQPWESLINQWKSVTSVGSVCDKNPCLRGIGWWYRKINEGGVLKRNTPAAKGREICFSVKLLYFLGLKYSVKGKKWVDLHSLGET